MRKMSFYFLVVSVICFSLLACSDDDPGTDKNIIVTNQEQLTQRVFADDLTGNKEVSFTTKGAWTSSISESGASNLEESILRSSEKSSSPDWISITPNSGQEAGDYEISINLTENLTQADRTATITIACGENTITITITQKATREDGTVPEEKRGGTGKFTYRLHNGLSFDFEVDNVTLKNNILEFYNAGNRIDLYATFFFSTENTLSQGTYHWTEYNLANTNNFYCQKGMINERTWYAAANKGTIDVSIKNEIYTIKYLLYIADNSDYHNGEIEGTYTGYLTVE